MEAIAASDAVSRMATALNARPSDSAGYLDLAKSMADSHQLDFLEFLDAHGTIISSAQWPAKFGYPMTAFESLSRHRASRRISEAGRIAGLDRAWTVRGAEHVESASIPIYVIGGRRLDKNFLSALDLPAGHARAALSESRRSFLGRFFDWTFRVEMLPIPPSPANNFATLIEAVRAVQPGDDRNRALVLESGR